MFKRGVPILHSRDLDRTAEFCENAMGMQIRSRYDGYLIVERDGVALHYGLNPGHKPEEAGACLVYVQDIDRLFADYSAAAIVHPNGHLQSKPYGVREFAITDPDNNLIRFCE